MQKGKGNNKKTTSEGTPPFVRKIFDMITTCDDSIASWHDDGTTFVVKDVVKFAAEVIPTYFKHSNFSSFVRQLNFYGFRKLKSANLRISETPCEETKYWTFRHEKFQQGSPCLLADIRKSTGSENSTGDIETLKKEIEAMREALSRVNQEVADLVRLVQSVFDTRTADQNHHGVSLVPGTSNKNKRKAATSLVRPLRTVSSQASLLTSAVAVVAILPPPLLKHIPSIAILHRAAPSAVRLADSITSGTFIDVALIKRQKIDDELLLLMMMPNLSASSMTSIRSKAIIYGEPTTMNADWRVLDSCMNNTLDEDGVSSTSFLELEDDVDEK